MSALCDDRRRRLSLLVDDCVRGVQCSCTCMYMCVHDCVYMRILRVSFCTWASFKLSMISYHRVGWAYGLISPRDWPAGKTNMNCRYCSTGAIAQIGWLCKYQHFIGLRGKVTKLRIRVRIVLKLSWNQ